jgi:hypothetical protein
VKPIFLKFKRDQNAAGKFLVVIDENAKSQNSIKADEIIV